MARARNLVISGGPTHDLAVTSRFVADCLDCEGIDSVVVDDIDEAFSRLSDPGQRWDLVTVNALRWRMEAERYAHLRDEWVYVLDGKAERALDAHVREGGGMLVLHTGMICFDGSAVWHRLAGASWNWERSMHPPSSEMVVEITAAGADHAVTQGVESFSTVDEAYGFLDEEPDNIVLATSPHSGRDHPIVWAREVGEGRVVADMLGHDSEAMRHPAQVAILRNAARWALVGRNSHE